MATYTLIQQASATIQAGTSLNVILPSAPTPGNSLFLFLVSAQGGDLFISSSLTQTGVTWGGAQLMSPPLGPTINTSHGFPILSGASNQLTIGLNLAHQSKPIVAIVMEYDGIKKDGSNYLDRSAIENGSSNIADSGDLFSIPSTGDEDLILGVTANMNGATQQTVIHQGTIAEFTRIAQESSNLSGGDNDVNVAIYEGVASAIVPVGVRFYEATLEASYPWASRILVIFPDESVTRQRTVSLNAFVVDTVGVLLNNLSLAVAEGKSKAVDLDVNIDPIRLRTAGMVVGVEGIQRPFSLMNLGIVALEDNETVGGPITTRILTIAGVSAAADRFYVDGDYTDHFLAEATFIVFGSTGNDGTYTVFESSLVSGQTLITVNEDITDPTVDGFIQYNVPASFFASVPMDVFIGEGGEIRIGMGVFLDGGTRPNVRVNLDVAVLATPPTIDSITTPEDNQYLTCRPRWCGVPKQYRFNVPMNVSIVAIGLKQSLLDMWITDTPATGVPTVDLEPQPALPVGAFEITAVSVGSKYFAVAVDLRRGIDPWREVTLAIDAQFRVKGSTGNDGLYDVDNIVYSGGSTYLYTVQAISSAVVDGYIEVQQGKTFAAMDILIDGERTV